MVKEFVFKVGFFEYEVKPIELAWAALTGAAAYIMTVSTAPVDVGDWKAFGIALASAAARPVFALVFGKAPGA